MCLASNTTHNCDRISSMNEPRVSDVTEMGPRRIETVPRGEPIGIAIAGFVLGAKQSTKAAMRQRADGTWYRHFYTKDTIAANATELRELLRPYTPSTPWTGPVRVELIVMSAYKTAIPKRDRCNPVLRQTLPDADNLAKQLMDVMQGLKWFAVGDGQVAELVVRKMWDNYSGALIWATQLERQVPLKLDGQLSCGRKSSPFEPYFRAEGGPSMTTSASRHG